MASPGSNVGKSTLDNVFGIIPEGHEKALKQAFYNTAATLFVVLACTAAVAVYYVLEIFLKPLMWALLCGAFLHPFKNTFSKSIQNWLKGLRSSGTPLVVGVTLLPLNLIDSTSEKLGGALLKHLKSIICVAVGLPVLYSIYQFGPVQKIIDVLVCTFYVSSDLIAIFGSRWYFVWSLAVGYILLVIFYWTPQTSRFLRLLSIPVWLGIFLHIATVAGPLRVPIFVALVIMMVVGFVSEVLEARREHSQETVESASSPVGSEIPTPQSPTVSAALKVLSGTNQSVSPGSSEHSTESKIKPPETIASQEATKSNQESSSSAPSLKLSSPTGATSKLGSPGRKNPPPSTLPLEIPKERSLPDKCFIGLMWAIGIVQLWKNIWVLQLLPLPFAYVLVKKACVKFGLLECLKFGDMWQRLSTWAKERKDAVAPKPVRGLGKLILRGDRKIVSAIETSTDKFMSVVIILALLVGAVLFTIFCAVQVHQESMHLVSITSNVMNNSLQPEITDKWLPKREMQKAMDSVAENAYVYGRQWLVDKIDTMIDGQNANKTLIEKQVLELWDRMYAAWFNKTTKLDGNHKPELQRQMSMTHISNIWDIAHSADAFNFDIVSFVKENIGIVTSVLESIWMVLKGNVNLLLGLVTSSLSVILGGGTAILNFVLASVVFLTTLFYLLASSGNTYKPVEWFSMLNPGGGAQGNNIGQAVEEAISGVFLASLKMAVFYGLYTWLIHTVFGVNMVFIPSALAAIFGAIPFLGTYWAAVPAVLELWLVHQEALLAAMLFLCQFAPTMFLDTAILSDIKGGGHPYLTGLAIAGGLYVYGLEGAIIGPILLCLLVVAMNLYSTMLNPQPTPSQESRVAARRLVGRNPKMGFMDMKRTIS
ncbi:unnamed protein product, partial [Owenia fusiformis]